MLVAFFVFGIIGVVSSQLLNQTLKAERILTSKGDKWQDIHRGMHILQRDIMQYIERPIRDQYGSPMEPLLIGLDGTIEFTRGGWRNPLGYKRSELQRVAYLWQDNNLVRGYWNELDRAVNSEPNYQVLLTDLERIEFFALDLKGAEHMTWPSTDSPQDNPLDQLAGIMVRIELEPNYYVERIWEIPLGK